MQVGTFSKQFVVVVNYCTYSQYPVCGESLNVGASGRSRPLGSHNAYSMGQLVPYIRPEERDTQVRDTLTARTPTKPSYHNHSSQKNNKYLPLFNARLIEGFSVSELSICLLHRKINLSLTPCKNMTKQVSIFLSLVLCKVSAHYFKRYVDKSMLERMYISHNTQYLLCR